MENFNGGLVHPLLEQMKNVNIKRYKDFDEEDMDTYMQVSHEDIHVEVYVHDKLILGADGFEDYREKFNNVLQYFKNDRKIDGFHTVTLANYTLNIDGSVIINLNYKMHERPKANPNAEKIWKSSGYYINHWVPLQKGTGLIWPKEKFPKENWKPVAFGSMIWNW